MTTLAPIDASPADQPQRPKLRGLRLFGAALRYPVIYRQFRDATLLSRNTYMANLYLAEKHLADPRLAGGCIVECGTWRGGMAAGLTVIGGPDRHYHFFDSFAGLPPAGREDGDYATWWQQHRDGTPFADNCTASRAEFNATMARTKVPADQLHVHQGFFEATLPTVDVTPIALLRLDADWYESTMLCLERFWDRLLPGALVLIDDYYAWEGCRKAVHAFLAHRDAVEPLRVNRFGKVVFLVRQ